MTDRQSSTSLETIFRNKQRRTVRAKSFNEDTIVEIFRKVLPPNKLSVIFTDDETFKIVQAAYSQCIFFIVDFSEYLGVWNFWKT